jgi:DNA ligase-1
MISPMLAHKFDPSHGVGFPVYVQPKYDGVRRLYSPQEGGWSRGGKKQLSQFDSLLSVPQKNIASFVLDGELMLPHSSASFQETISAVKRFQPKSQHVRYFIYDVYLPGTPALEFRFRWSQLLWAMEWWGDRISDNIMLSPTYMVYNMEELVEKHAEFVAEGFEGSIIRYPNSQYLVGERSRSLLKWKDWLSDEYEIVEVIEGIGKDVGMAMFVCKTASGQMFKARPAQTYEARAQLWDNKDSLPGKFVTVRYQNLSDRGVPRFPIALTIRDYE